MCTIIDPQVVYGEEVTRIFGEGQGQIWMDDVKCSGKEKNIFSCVQLILESKNNCFHSEDSGIKCLSKCF